MEVIQVAPDRQRLVARSSERRLHNPDQNMPNDPEPREGDGIRCNRAERLARWGYGEWAFHELRD